MTTGNNVLFNAVVMRSTQAGPALHLNQHAYQSMSKNLHFDGFYYIGPVDWEDWHAGVRMHGIHFHYARYFSNGDWLGCYRDHEFGFWEFTESVTPELLADAKRDRAPRIADADPLCLAGHYSVEGSMLTQVLAPDWTGGEKWQSRFKILEDRLLATDQDRAWLFQPKPIC